MRSLAGHDDAVGAEVALQIEDVEPTHLRKGGFEISAGRSGDGLLLHACHEGAARDDGLEAIVRAVLLDAVDARSLLPEIEVAVEVLVARRAHVSEVCPSMPSVVTGVWSWC